ncbi:MAG: hypothetical protein LPK25_03905, partial [Cyclobacteriaceae bacterium]|nr:hypothetical protein [Cyclobacteriaceae bacterium]
MFKLLSGDVLLARKYSERGCRKIDTATEVIASIPTRMTPVLPDKPGATVLKSALQRVIEFSKKRLRCLSPVSIRSQLFKSRGN